MIQNGSRCPDCGNTYYGMGHYCVGGPKQPYQPVVTTGTITINNHPVTIEAKLDRVIELLEKMTAHIK